MTNPSLLVLTVGEFGDRVGTRLAQRFPTVLIDAVAGTHQRQPSLGGGLAPVQRMLVQAAIGRLPDWARRMHGLSQPPLGPLVANAGAWGVAGSLRWAYGGVRR